MIQGAEVQFGNGGVVTQVKLSSDFSAIQTLRLLNNSQQETIIALLEDYGHVVPASKIAIKHIETTSKMAEVRVEDPKFSDDISRRFRNDYTEKDMKKVSVKPILETGAAGSHGNRLQLSSICCTWHQPSRLAWLKFISHSNAEDAKMVLKQYRIFDRKIVSIFPKNVPGSIFSTGILYERHYVASGKLGCQNHT